jgi:hypothetical protein
MKISISFLLFFLSLFAQQPYSAFQKTLDRINVVLYQTKNVQYINQDHDVFNLRKIQSNPKGNVFLMDSFSNEDAKPNYKMFNLLDVKEFVGKGNQIQVMDKNDQKIGAFINVKVQDWHDFIKDFRALQHICDLYAKEDPKYKCTDPF